MSMKANKTLIGGFVVGAVALILVSIMLFGGGLFKESLTLVTYFESSVTGLGIGAKVQLKGLTVGEVKDIRLLFNSDDLSFLNRVIIEVTDPKIASYYDIGNKKPLREPEPDPEVFVVDLINRGLRAKLALESIVTGKLLVALDFYPETRARLRGIEPELIEIPTLPKDFEKIARALSELPIEEMVFQIKDSLKGINKLVNSLELKQAMHALNQTLQNTEKLTGKINDRAEPMLADLDRTLADYGTLARKVDAHIGPLADGITDTVRDAQKFLREINKEVVGVFDSAQQALDQAKATLATIEAFAEDESRFQHSVNDALKQVELAARSIRQLADYLEKHPEALVRGKAPSGGK